MKPKRGFARDIYEIVQADGPLAYNGIHERLRKRKVRMSKDQVKRCLINMQQRQQLVRSDQNYNKFVVVANRKAPERAEMPDPIQSPSLVEKTPESVEITPTEGLIDDRTLGELKQSVFDKALILSGMLSVISVVAAVTAVLTIYLLRFL